MGVSASWVLTGDDAPCNNVRTIVGDPRSESQDFIPILRFAVEASAGPGSLPDNEETSGFHVFNKMWLARRRLAPAGVTAVAVGGDSTEPTLSNGDLRLGDDLLVKHILRLGPATVAPVSANTAHAPREVRIDEFANDDPTFALIGRVVASMHEW